jgi:hypothetical protein
MAVRQPPRFIGISIIVFLVLFGLIALHPRSPRLDLKSFRHGVNDPAATVGIDRPPPREPSPDDGEWSHGGSSSSLLPSPSPSPSLLLGDIDRAANETLGFSKVFVVGLPERSDKRDAIALTSSLTGFRVEWVDGVKGESVPDKAVPFGVDREKLWESNLGSWRGHMNAIRR